MHRPLKDEKGLIRGYEISARGEVVCSWDEDHPIPMRVVGKTSKVYRQVQLMVRGRLKWIYVHRLMGFTWLRKPQSSLRKIVDHIDGNSLNNSVNNLRWVTTLGNNINRKCYGLIQEEEEGGRFIPKVAGFLHTRYASECEKTALEMRKMLVECYVRYTMKHPENGSNFPHKSIHTY